MNAQVNCSYSFYPLQKPEFFRYGDKETYSFVCDSVGPRYAVGPQVASIRTLSQRNTHSNLSVTAATTTAAGSAGGEGGRITLGQHKREGVVEARACGSLLEAFLGAAAGGQHDSQERKAKSDGAEGRRRGAVL